MRREDGWMAGRQKTFNLPRNATGKQQGAHKSPHHLPRLDTIAPCSWSAPPSESALCYKVTRCLILNFHNPSWCDGQY